uniref:Transmembrane protein 200B n=1 Tax=Cyprinus carpio TaxID=7962 RepID=A0A8C0YJU1_CYPCA
MRTQKSRGRTSATPSRQRLPRFSLHSRRKKEGVIQGKLRIRSMPGAFLVLGVVVVVVGTSLAVAGYWPYRAHRSSVDTTEEGSSGSASGWGLGSKGLFSAASLVHSERMKLLGPVIMGVGLFILICANTVLYENRDRETQMLLAQMRSVICSVSAAVPSADLLYIIAFPLKGGAGPSPSSLFTKTRQSPCLYFVRVACFCTLCYLPCILNVY